MQLISRLNVNSDADAAPGARNASARDGRHAVTTRYITALLHSLADAESLWRILELSGDATYFQTFEVFAAWTQNIAPAYGVEWFVLAVLDRVTLLPLMLLPLTLVKRGGLRVIEAADLGVCDFNAPIVDRRFNPDERAMLEVWHDALALFPEADLVRLTKMPAHIGACPNPLLSLGSAHKIKLANFKTPLTVMGRMWSQHMLPEKLRLDLAARRRKLSKRGKLDFRIAETQQEADRYFAAMLEQRAARFKAMGREDVLACPLHQRFYRALIEPASQTSPACIQALLLDGEPIATGYGLQSQNSFGMIFPTFKAEGWRNYSPGLQLFLESMTHAAAKGLAYYDFTIGGESFKLDLGALEYPLYEHLEPLTLRARPHVYRERIKHHVIARPRLKNMIEHALPRRLLHIGSPHHAHAQR